MSGILAYGEDAEYINVAKTKDAEELEINSIADIFNIPQLKNFKSAIQEYSLSSSIISKR